jgi:hypothetical protein
MEPMIPSPSYEKVTESGEFLKEKLLLKQGRRQRLSHELFWCP